MNRALEAEEQRLLPPPSVQAVLFDMDGTLADTLEDLYLAVNAGLQAAGYPLRRREEVRAFVGNGMPKLIERAVPAGAEQEGVMAVFRAHYAAHGSSHTRPYSGVLPLLRRLRARGLKLGVVSNKAEEPLRALCQTLFPDTFDVIVGQRPGLPTKPAPDMPRLALRLMGVRAENTLYVGDSEVDFATGEAAGLYTLCALWGFRTREQLAAVGARVFLSAPGQLTAFLPPLQPNRQCALVLNSPQTLPPPSAPFVIAADGGQRHARCTLWVGDGDSSCPPAQAPCIVLPTHKDYTDGKLALLVAQRLGYRRLLILGVTGGSEDHVFANLSLLVQARRAGMEAVGRGAEVTAFYFENRATITTRAGTKISLIPFAGAACVAHASGLEYPLEHLWLSPEDMGRGVSNCAHAPRVHIRVAQGGVLALVYDAQATVKGE